MFKNILRLVVGNGLAQFIQFASIPILTKYYSPENFGAFAVTIAVAGVLSVIFSLQLNVAVVSLKSYAAVRRLLSSALLLNLCLLLLFLPLALLVYINIFDEKLTLAITFYMVIITFFSSLNNMLKGIFVYLGVFHTLSKVLLLRAVVIVSLQFFFVNIAIEDGLIIGLLVGEIIMFLAAFWLQLKLKFNVKLLSKRAFLQLFLSLKKLKSFVLYGTLQELVSVVVFWLPLIAITYLYGSAIGGQYSISARILWPATVLVSSSIAQVLYHRMVKKTKLELSNEFFLSHKFKLLYIPLALVAYYMSPVIFNIILDEQWHKAIQLSKFVSLLCVTFLYALPYRVMFRVFKTQKKQLRIESFIAIILLLLMFVANIYTNIINIQTLMVCIIFLMLCQAVWQEIYIRNDLNRKVGVY
jgi:O-antigen/teichoic acid export membrane protein